MSLGELAVLNVGAGDIKVVFNQADTGETKKAIRMLKDMQQRGYAIMVQLPDQTYVRAKRIDESTNSYVIVVPDEMVIEEAVPVLKKRHKRGGKQVKVPIRKSRAVGVARSAGG